MLNKIDLSKIKRSILLIFSNDKVDKGLIILEKIFNNFQVGISSISKNRHNSRETIKINDEYDVQYILYFLLLVYFGNVIREETTRKYLGKSSRIDFFIKELNIAIEVKKTRNSLKESEIADQLINDVARYKQHKDCKILVFFIYDPDRFILDPNSFEEELNKELNQIDRDRIIKTYVRA